MRRRLRARAALAPGPGAPDDGRSLRARTIGAEAAGGAGHGGQAKGAPMRTRKAAAGEAQALKLVPPIEKVRLTKLTTTDGTAYVGVELAYHTPGGEATRLELGLSACDAAALGAELVQLGEKLGATEH